MRWEYRADQGISGKIQGDEVMGGRGSSSELMQVNLGRGGSISKNVYDFAKKVTKMEREYNNSRQGQINQPTRGEQFEANLKYSISRIIREKGKENVKKEFERREKLLNERKRKTSSEQKTFVNGFGEATRREITSSSYKRSQSRIENEINNMFGIKKRKRRK